MRMGRPGREILHCYNCYENYVVSGSQPRHRCKDRKEGTPFSFSHSIPVGGSSCEAAVVSSTMDYCNRYEHDHP